MYFGDVPKGGRCESGFREFDSETGYAFYGCERGHRCLMTLGARKANPVLPIFHRTACTAKASFFKGLSQHLATDYMGAQGDRGTASDPLLRNP